MHYADYLLLVDGAGRALRPGKRGAISANMAPILDRLGMEPNDWIREMKYYGRWHYRAVGSIHALKSYAEHLGRQWLKGSGRVSAHAA